MRQCGARYLFGLQIPVNTGEFELRISCMRSSYLTDQAIRPSELGHYFVCKRFAVQTLLWSLEFVIQINLEHDTIVERFVWLLFGFKNLKRQNSFRNLHVQISRIIQIVSYKSFRVRPPLDRYLKKKEQQKEVFGHKLFSAP